MNKTKIIGFGIMFMLSMLMIVNTASAASNAFPQILISMINQEPDPVAPGSTVDVRFRIENEGSGMAPEVEVKIVPQYPFSFYGDEQEIKSIGSLEGGQDGNLGVREKWTLYVDPAAVAGENYIEFWYKFKGSVWTKTGDYAISVRTQNAVLTINEINVGQDKIIPGTKTNIEFVLENLAENNLKDVTLTLEILQSYVTSTSVTTNELPFTPIGSGNSKTIKSLSSGESKEISFDLFTDATAESKVYKVPYTLTYSDNSGANFTKEGIVGLIVEADPDISVNIDKTDIISAGSKGTIEIKFVNKGFSDIKFLDIRLDNGEQYTVLSNPEVYIGKLDSDDYETAEYELMIDENVEGDLVLPLMVEYRGANGKLFQKEVPLDLKLYSGEELKQRSNGKQSSGWMWAIIIAVVLIVGFYFYKKRKNSKKK